MISKIRGFQNSSKSVIRNSLLQLECLFPSTNSTVVYSKIFILTSEIPNRIFFREGSYNWVNYDSKFQNTKKRIFFTKEKMKLNIS